MLQGDLDGMKHAASPIMGENVYVDDGFHDQRQEYARAIVSGTKTLPSP